MKEIPLTRGQVALIDDADYAALARYRWHAVAVHGGKFYARRSARAANGSRIKIYMHREIIGAMAGIEVDHINGHTLNNQRSNLRTATHRQNLCNQKTPICNTTGYRGVSLIKKTGKWFACIREGGKTYRLGTYENAIDAALAFDAAAIRLRGDFARLNFLAVPDRIGGDGNDGTDAVHAARRTCRGTDGPARAGDGAAAAGPRGTAQTDGARALDGGATAQGRQSRRGGQPSGEHGHIRGGNLGSSGLGST